MYILLDPEIPVIGIYQKKKKIMNAGSHKNVYCSTIKTGNLYIQQCMTEYTTVVILINNFSLVFANA